MAKKLVRREVRGWLRRARQPIRLWVQRKTIFWRPLRKLGRESGLRPSICPPVNFAPQSSRARMRLKGFRKKFSSCGQKKYSTGPPHLCLKVPIMRDHLFDMVSTRSRRCNHRPLLVTPKPRSTIGFSLPTMPFRFSRIILARFPWKVLASGQAGSGGSSRCDSLLRSVNAARNTKPRRSHWLLRTADLPGARRGHRAEP